MIINDFISHHYHYIALKSITDVAKNATSALNCMTNHSADFTLLPHDQVKPTLPYHSTDFTLPYHSTGFTLPYHRTGFTLPCRRADFPILNQKINGYPLTWLDNAATTQKPHQVLERINKYYTHENSNVHRGAHTLATRATDALEEARKKVANFINASSSNQIIFTKGATEGLNIVAHSFLKPILSQNDQILLTAHEHHANIVPWQIVAKECGANIKIAPLSDDGSLDINVLESLITPHTKLISVAHVTNILGAVIPVRQIVNIAKNYNIPVCVDGAQSVAHMPIDLQSLDADFFVFSGHKMYGPTGIGVLYAKAQHLEQMIPYQTGGNMISNVDYNGASLRPAPHKFEAGTANIVGAVGLGAAVDYLMDKGMQNISSYLHDLTQYAVKKLHQVSGLNILGYSPAFAARTGVLPFTIADKCPDKISQHLDNYGIAIRSGHHCSQPTLRRYSLESVARASLGIYNTREDVNWLAKCLRQH